MLSNAAASETSSSSSGSSERRLAANRANAQLSTGPRSEEGKARSSLNAVKTGLCGRTILVADEEEAQSYRAHVERLQAYWAPGNVEEHALVQSLADTQWRLESIPGLESALYARTRLRSESLLPEADGATQRLLLDAETEVAEAKALRNLRLHERRLRAQLEKDKAELNDLRNERLEQEEQEEAEHQRRQRAESLRTKKAAVRSTAPPNIAEPELTADGFEFSTFDPHTSSTSPHLPAS